MTYRTVLTKLKAETFTDILLLVKIMLNKLEATDKTKLLQINFLHDYECLRQPWTRKFNPKKKKFNNFLHINNFYADLIKINIAVHKSQICNRSVQHCWFFNMQE
jgi:hypothetical protein